MTKPLKLSLLFGATVACWAIAVYLLVSAFSSTVKNTKSLVAFEAPGSADFTVKEATKITVWHDYETYYASSFIENPPALPGGFSFEMTTIRGEPLAPLEPSGMNTTSHFGSTRRSAVGTFNTPEAGTYTLQVKGPPGEPRIISVTHGTFGAIFTKLLGSAGGAFLLGIIGFITMVWGIISIFSKPRNPPPVPQ
ncbi:MAG: hypothetical protein Q7Q71_10730 [Verrucomicrobiota bacterium JB023]|nr:hypothetical protein [Verrucomicrobiota bacterium JB023]